MNNKKLLQKCLDSFERISDRLHYEDGECVTTLTGREIEETYLDAIENLVELEKVLAKEKAKENKIEFTRIDKDVNGNPRYVCHFLNFITDKDYTLGGGYSLALKRAKKLGGRKFHNKQYGGGIVFQSYNIRDTERAIQELMKQHQ